MNKDELKQRRERLGLSQAGFAKEVGVAANTIWRYETEAVPIPQYMELILEALEARQIKKLQTPIKKAAS